MRVLRGKSIHLPRNGQHEKRKDSRIRVLAGKKKKKKKKKK